MLETNNKYSAMRSFCVRLWLLMLVCCVNPVAAETVISMDFENDDVLKNEGEGDDPLFGVHYSSQGAYHRRDLSIPTLADRLVATDDGQAIRLGQETMLEFDHETTKMLLKNGIIRMATRFKMDNVAEPYPELGNMGTTLFEFRAIHPEIRKYPDLLRDSLRIRLKRIKGTDKVHMVLRGPPMRMFSNVPTGIWMDFLLTIDFNRKVVAARLDDRYFQASLDQFDFSNGKWDKKWYESGEMHPGTQLRLGWAPMEPYHWQLPDLYLESVAFDNDYPENPDHDGYKESIIAFKQYLLDSSTLDPTALRDHYVVRFLSFLVRNARGYFLGLKDEEVHAELVKDFIDTYEQINEPLFNDRSVAKVLHKYPIIDRVLAILQHDITVMHFNDDGMNVDGISSIKFASRESFPGLINGVSDAGDLQPVTVPINGTFTKNKNNGVTWYSPAHRPTGYYAIAGKEVQVCVPDELVGLVDVIAGAHPPLNLSRVTSRNFTIVTRYSFDENCTTLANPYGGGIYIRVPQGLKAGWFDVSISGGAVKAPFFDYRADLLRPLNTSRTTNDQFTVALQASIMPPWVDLEANSWMFTVPTNAALLVDDPEEVMAKWEKIDEGVLLFQGREEQFGGYRPRPEYLVVDSNSYCRSCAGYWMTLPALNAGLPVANRQKKNDNWEYGYGLALFNITKDDGFYRSGKFEHSLHEKGHNLSNPRPAGEVESMADIIKLVGWQYALGASYGDALTYHNQRKSTIEKSLFDWMLMEQFLEIYKYGGPETLRTAPPPGKRRMGTMRARGYDSRPQIKYIDLAQLFGGWKAVGYIMKEHYKNPDMNNGVRQDPAFARLAVEAFFNNAELGKSNPLPLLEFWGVVPDQDTYHRSILNLKPDNRIRQRLEYYKSLIPATKADFDARFSDILVRGGGMHAAVVKRFRTASDSYETAKFKNGDIIGYRAAMEARFNQIFDDYFDAPKYPPITEDFEGGCEQVQVDDRYIYALIYCNANTLNDVSNIVNNVIVEISDSLGNVLHRHVRNGQLKTGEGFALFVNGLGDLIDPGAKQAKMFTKIIATPMSGSAFKVCRFSNDPAKKTILTAIRTDDDDCVRTRTVVP